MDEMSKSVKPAVFGTYVYALSVGPVVHPEGIDNEKFVIFLNRKELDCLMRLLGISSGDALSGSNPSS